MRIKLTADFVRVKALREPPAREATYYDAALPRFALRVRPPAAPGRPWASTYLVRYRGPSGEDTKHVIGSPATLDLDAARRTARAKLAIVDRGGDPAAEKLAARERWSIEQAIEAYLASPEFRRKTPKTRSCDAASLRLHVVHRLGRLALADLDVPRAKRLLHAIETDTRSNARGRRMGGAGAARKCARVFSAVLSWCVGEGQLPRNPLIGALRLSGDGTRETVITEPEQYGRLFAAMDAMVAEGTLRAFARAFITTAALTGCRRGELQALTWGQVDLGAGRITLTGSKGAKLARTGLKTETIALPPFAASTLAGIRPEAPQDDERVFVPRRGSKLEVNRDWIRVRERAGLPADLVLHGLRHSAGTVAVIAGLSLPEIQKLLRHRNVSTTSKYIHLADRTRLQDRALGHLAPPVPKRSGA
jgi:integrase